ncbi:MAG: hypothetical protein JNG89_13020, partial [Planctomycetaceae bacterium]|nr:hypothetical protein [Planctomycetaceae bacterium]
MPSMSPTILKRGLVCVVAVLAVLFGGYFALVMSGPWSMLYYFEGRFGVLPATDEQLVAAIEDCPRIIRDSVYVVRI